jgi:ABC-type bacteriocin/lantibiotic exporter with double-glycine peptidase domain
MWARRLTELKNRIEGLGTLSIKAGESAPRAGLAAFRRFGPYLRRHRRTAIIGAGLIGLSTFAGLAAPLAMRHLVDEAILGRRLGLVAGGVLLLAGCLAAEKLLRIAHELCFARFEQAVLLAVQNDLIERVLRLPKAFFDERQTGYLTRRLAEDVESLRYLVSGAVVNAAGQALRLAGGLGLVFYLEWRIAAAVVALLPLLAAGVVYLGRRVHRLSHARLESQAAAAGRIQESLADVPAIKSFAAEQRAGERIMVSLRTSFRIAFEQALVGSVSGALIQSIPGIGRLAALAAGAVLVIRGEWSLGSLLAFQAYLVHVFGPAQFLSAANHQLQRARAALERVAALFEIVPEDEGRGGLRVERLEGAIEFRNISFAYAGAVPVLEGICLRVRPGESLAIRGPSGVGKTTLLSLLLRFYQPTSGEIYFDGRPARDYETSSLRRRMGYVPQAPRLSSGSILENLRLGNPEASAGQVAAAARLAGIHDEVLSFPNGYATAVGEGGLRLSAGQNQRLALARALVADPDILILDEPTAALDADAEQTILNSLSTWRRGRTLIVVTHRPATAGLCDRIVALDGGRIVENGSPVEIGRQMARPEPIANCSRFSAG